jgi:hypothetical protein
MTKVVVTDSIGLYQVRGGTGVEINTPVTFTQFPTVAVVAKTAADTLVNPGVYTLSGGSPQTWVMPTAASVPGGTFVFRCLSAQAHVLTGSQEAPGTKVFAGFPGGTPDANGSRLTLPAVIGSSVALVSDGVSFLLMAASGSCTIDGA